MRWVAFIALVACVETPKGLGVECSRTSQCDTPLVCRLQACRTECRDARDCPRGAVCLVDADGLGACRLSDEASCATGNDCPASIECISGACRNACGDDCGLVSCASDDDCAVGERCIDGECRPECVSDRDCFFGGSCVTGRCAFGDGAVDASDASLDGRTVDSGIDWLPGVSSFGTGPTYSCAVSGGRVLCWGGFEWFEAPPTTSVPPIELGLGVRVVARPRARHFCVISAEGALTCAGSNFNGVLGDGSMVSRGSPVPVVGLDANVEDVAVGNRHSCAIVSSNVHCWGNAINGRLGDGRDELAIETEPIDIGLSGAVDVAAGSDQSCAVIDDGRLLCWGNNSSGQAGLGALPSATSPTDTGVTFNATQVSLGADQGCAIADDASLHCWGLGRSNTPTRVMGIDAVDVSVGSTFTCVVTVAREVQCWGFNQSGQLGNGMADPTGTMVSEPGSSVGLTEVDDVESGDAHACARRGEELWCWGFNQYGQLGAGHRGTTDTPVPVLEP